MKEENLEDILPYSLCVNEQKPDSRGEFLSQMDRDITQIYRPLKQIYEENGKGDLNQNKKILEGLKDGVNEFFEKYSEFLRNYYDDTDLQFRKMDMVILGNFIDCTHATLEQLQIMQESEEAPTYSDVVCRQLTNIPDKQGILHNISSRLEEMEKNPLSGTQNNYLETLKGRFAETYNQAERAHFGLQESLPSYMGYRKAS